MDLNPVNKKVERAYPPLKQRYVRGGPSIYNTEVASFGESMASGPKSFPFYGACEIGFISVHFWWCHFCVIDGRSPSDRSVFQWRIEFRSTSSHSGNWAFDVPGPVPPASLLAPLRTSAPAPRTTPLPLHLWCLPPAAGNPAQSPHNFAILQHPPSSSASILKRQAFSPGIPLVACIVPTAPTMLLGLRAPSPWKYGLTTKNIQGPRSFPPSSGLISFSTLPWPWTPAAKGLDTKVQQVAHRLQSVWTNYWLLVYMQAQSLVIPRIPNSLAERGCLLHPDL